MYKHIINLVILIRFSESRTEIQRVHLVGSITFPKRVHLIQVYVLIFRIPKYQLNFGRFHSGTSGLAKME